MKKYPQKIINVKVKQNFNPLGSSTVNKLIDQIKNKLGNDGRVVLRNSGTEPIFRIMVEGEDEGTVNNLAKELESEVRSVSE
jgi:phosphoglucosamine mutase